ncbi:MAG: hypothetical protein MRZ54_04040 [Clostridiales bacterium]|nr:hypothetical protein [Clostridiales bacterium]
MKTANKVIEIIYTIVIAKRREFMECNAKITILKILESFPQEVKEVFVACVAFGELKKQVEQQ